MNSRQRLLAALLLLPLALAACKEEVVCPEGETACGGRCVPLLSDAANCGACGAACGDLQVCGAGSCLCAPGVATCDGACTDLARDPASCGACGAACPAAAGLCLTDAGATSCVAACPAGFTACEGACVALPSDRLHCGACGRACGAGESCREGTCRADVHVACYASGDVRPVTRDLGFAGPARSALGSPTSLALSDGVLYTANGFPAGVAVLPLDPARASSLSLLAGNDLQHVAVHGGALLVANAGAGTLVVLDAAGGVLDEIVLPGDNPNPHGLAVLGDTAYVALYGDGPGGFSGFPEVTGQRIARVDLSSLAACAAPDPAPPACGTGGACPAGRECRGDLCRVRCGLVTGEIDLLAVPGSADEGAYPFPSRLVAAGRHVYATLSNLAYADLGGGFAGWFRPAGPGKLAVIDPDAGESVSIESLGEGCQNPGAIAASGDDVWIACGSFSFADLAPGALVSVRRRDRTGTPGAAPPLDASAVVPGNLAFCGDLGYVTDQATGAVLRFHPSSRSVDAPVEVCPRVYDFAWATDVACAE